MSKKLNKCLFWYALTLFFFTTCAYAGTSYSLQKLSELAVMQSENIKIAHEDVYIAKQEKKRALSVLIPKIAAYGNITRYKNDEISSPDTNTFGIKLTQSFTLNGKELIALDMTKKDIESKEFSLESIRAGYILQVAQAYYNILSAQRFVEIANADVERLTTHRNAVKEKLNVGNVTKTDLYRAEAELSKSLTEKVKAENTLLKARAVLQNLVHLDADFSLDKKNIPGIEGYNTDLDEIRTYALTHRPEIKQAAKNLEIARQTIKFNKSDYWPSVSLEAGYKETDIDYDAGPAHVQYDTEDLYVKGGLVFTLFDGGLRAAQIRQAVAGQRKAMNALELEKKKIILESETAFLEYKTAKNTLNNLKHEVKSAMENFNAVKMQFRYGMADSIDMMDANTLLVTSQRRISDARYTFYLSVLKILYTRGDLISFLLGHA
jgi:outer membrane protein